MNTKSKDTTTSTYASSRTANDADIDNGTLVRTSSPILPLSQCNNQLIQMLEDAEKERAGTIIAAEQEADKNKKRKVTPSKNDQTNYLPKCSFCKMKMNDCHEIKFGGYCLSKVLVFCEDKENSKSLDWVIGKCVYNEAYKEIWRVCTYLETDYYDPTDSTLDVPDCMANSSYKEAQEIVRCKMALNRVQTYIWKGAMKKAYDADFMGTGMDNSNDEK